MEILVVLVVALIVFGPKRLPELGNSLGKGIRDFSKGIKGEEPESPLAKLDPAQAKAEAGDGVKATQSS